MSLGIILMSLGLCACMTLAAHHKKVIIHVPYRVKTIHHTHTIYKQMPKHEDFKVIGYSGDVDSGQVIHGSSSHDAHHSFGDFGSSHHHHHMHPMMHHSAVTFAPSSPISSHGHETSSMEGHHHHFSSFGSFGHQEHLHGGGGGGHHLEHQQQQQQEDDEVDHNGLGSYSTLVDGSDGSEESHFGGHEGY